MSEPTHLAAQFEENRNHLRAVAYRMLGSLSEAEDAVQEAWLRLNRQDAGSVDNLGGWLTTVVARVCLDMLRSRKARREDALPENAPESAAKRTIHTDPEMEASLADSVGLALLIVLDRLAPAERLAFVLHDMFDLPFEEIASITGRTPVAARQLASRARRRVHGGSIPPKASVLRQRKVVDAFLTALRAGDFQGLVAVLDPNLVVHGDAVARNTPGFTQVDGIENWAKQAINLARGARFARVVLINGTAGIAVALHGRLFRALQFTVQNGKVAHIEVLGDPANLANLDLAVLDS